MNLKAKVNNNSIQNALIREERRAVDEPIDNMVNQIIITAVEKEIESLLRKDIILEKQSIYPIPCKQAQGLQLNFGHLSFSQF